MIKLIWANIKERKWTFIIYTVSSVLFLLLYVALFPSLQSQAQQLTEVLKTLPANLLKALGSDPSQMRNFTLEALLASKQFSLFWQMLAAFFAISIAASDLAGEIEKGTIEFLLSQPISRLKLYFSRFLSGSILLTIFTAASTLLVIPMSAAFKISYNASAYYKLFFVALLFALALYAIAFCLSAIFSTRSKVFGIGAATIITMYAAFLFSALKDSLDKLKYISFFHYLPPDLLTSGKIDNVGVWVFILTIIISVTIGAIVFQKRDIVTN
jgi:ABC-2 type transport system permease protein